MDNLNLQPNESTIAKCEQATFSKGTFSLESGDLVLTNLNLLWVVKGAFKGIKKLERYPLSSIMMYEGKALVSFDSKNGINSLTFSFRDGQRTYRILASETDNAKTIANSINHILTGTDTDLYTIGVAAGVAFIAEGIKGTVDTFKDVFGIKSNDQQNAAPNQRVARKCCSCGAPLSGIAGQVVCCEYCDTQQQL